MDLTFEDPRFLFNFVLPRKLSILSLSFLKLFFHCYVTIGSPRLVQLVERRIRRDRRIVGSSTTRGDEHSVMIDIIQSAKSVQLSLMAGSCEELKGLVLVNTGTLDSGLTAVI